MRKLLLFLIAAALLVTPALAAGEDAVPADEGAVPAAENTVPAGDSDCAHHFEVTVLREATCTEKGLVACSCTKCGLTYTAETQPDGAHEYQLAETSGTCTEGGTATYVCTRCGDSYTEDLPPAGHTPEEQPASCTHSQVCQVCGEVLAPATGHSYTYQYDAEKDEHGGFLSFGTWKCDNCGRTMDATEGNALYYYSLPEAVSSATSTDADAVTAEDDTASDAEAAAGQDTPDPNTGLWVIISVVALVAILAEAAVLVRSLRKKKVER